MNIKTVEGQQYTIGKLNAQKQFHILRRLTPFLVPILEAWLDAKGEGAKLTDVKLGEILGSLTEGPALEKIASTLADMPDDKIDYIMFTSMEAVKRGMAGQWMPVKVNGQNRLMYDDISGSALLQLTGLVIWENLGNFFSGSAPNSSAPEAVTASSS